ncbi:YLR456W and YPR172W [Zygosaccharomyces parabailii]|nr:YLR456W and YPR172W [Zygosaccharomyces parabailii]
MLRRAPGEEAKEIGITGDNSLSTMSCTDKFPPHLRELVKSSKYVHVATCSRDCVPTVSLMNYIYVPADKTYENNKDENAYIVFATLTNTEKYRNICANPKVSLLFHDWITAKSLSVRKHSLSQSPTPDQPEPSEHPSKLLNLLQELNQAELFQMSANLRGQATVIDPNNGESKYYKDLLLKVNPDAHVFIQGDNTVLVKVQIESAKVSDAENNTSVYN